MMHTIIEQNHVHEVPRAERIGRLNDTLRKTGKGGHMVITRGIHALDGFSAPDLLKALADYDDFDPMNDPHGERDLGSFDYLGREVLWKIDYYDLELRFGSDDAADPGVTQRVLTILLAEEY
jgi:hypothetical protein